MDEVMKEIEAAIRPAVMSGSSKAADAAIERVREIVARFLESAGGPDQ